MSLCHNPYFNRWFSAITYFDDDDKIAIKVTILILIDGFLQYSGRHSLSKQWQSHNPYFNRWFSAMK